MSRWGTARESAGRGGFRPQILRVFEELERNISRKMNPWYLRRSHQLPQLMLRRPHVPEEPVVG